MEKECRKRYNLILSAEDSFARAVALGVWMQRPLTAWHYLLPGMFLFDFTRRSGVTKRYSSFFLFPRKLALDVAWQMLQGEDQSHTLVQAEGELKEWLTHLKLHSDRILRGHMKQIQVLVSHYSNLLQAEGDNYPALVRNIYKTSESYQAFLQELSLAEQEVDKAIAEQQGETQEVWKRLRAEQAQVEDLRKKENKKIFSRTE